MSVVNDGRVWFGNLRKAQWIAAPSAGMDAGFFGNEEIERLANGGAFGRIAGATHREFDMAWPQNQIDEFHFLMDYRNGVYGSGLCYMVDPYAADVNALPPHWANPSLTGRGWPSLIAQGEAPTLTPTTASAITTYAQPYETAQYAVNRLSTALPPRAVTLLIPTGSVLWVGFSGVGTGATIRAVPILLDGTEAAGSNLTLLSPTASTRLNQSYSSATYSAVRFYIVTTTELAGSISLTSAKAIYSPIGTTPTLTGNHVEGRGHSGLMFSSSPIISYTHFNNTNGKRYATAAVSMVEVGSWL